MPGCYIAIQRIRVIIKIKKDRRENMKKKLLAFLLAGSMLASGSVTALAGELTDGSEGVIQETELLESGEGMMTEPEVLSETEVVQDASAEEERAASYPVSVDTAHFPDKAFRSVATSYDKNRDGKLSKNETDSVREMDIKHKNIASLQGMEYFGQLQILDCSGNPITSLDVSQNKKLQKLTFNWTEVRTVSIDGLKELKGIYFIEGEVSKVNLTNLPNLEVLTCAKNKISSLNLKNLPKLNHLSCSENKLTSLNLSPFKNLRDVWCYNNEITEMDVTGLDLRTLSCMNNYMNGESAIKGLDKTGMEQYGFEPQYVAVQKPSAPVLNGAYNSASGILIKWKPSSNAKGYRVYRKSGKESWKQIADVGNKTSYTDTSVKEKGGTSYTYTVRAYNGKKLSDYDKKGKTLARLGTPSLSGIYNSRDGVLVKWKQVKGADGYVVYRKSGNGEFEQIAKVKGINTLSSTDKGAKGKNGASFTYTVKAYKGKDYSAWNGGGKKILRLESPEVTSIANWTGSKLNMKWKQNSAADGYEIQYSTSSQFTWNKSLKTGKASSQTFYNLTKNKRYYVRIRSFKKTGNTTYYSAWTTKNAVIKK